MYRCWVLIFCFKQKTAYDRRISDWSSDVCSSDLRRRRMSDEIQDGQATEDQGDSLTDEALAIPLADLRPALEAVLMVADQPLDEVTLATTVGYPSSEVDRKSVV